MSAITCEEVVRDHIKYLGKRFSCANVEGRLWIVSPYRYQDGDLIEITINELRSGGWRVSDLGETLRHLANHGFDPRLTAKGEYQLSEVLKQHQAELDRGMITKRATLAELGAAVQQVLMACLAIAHLVYLSRSSSPATFTEEVAHLLVEENINFEPRHREAGKSGTKYDFDFLVHGKHNDGLLVTLSPMAPSGTTGMVNATFRKWSDVLNGRLFGTVLDDRLVQWRPYDIALLDGVSHVYRWSDQVTFRKALFI